MSELVELLLFTLAVILVSALMTAYYLRVTSRLDERSVLFWLRLPNYLMPIATLIGTLAFIYAVAKLGQKEAIAPFVLTVSVLSVQACLSLVTFIVPKTRSAALGSLEYRVLAALFSFIPRIVGALFRAISGLMRPTSSAGRSRDLKSGDDGTRNAFGYHGYLTHEEKAKKDFGQNY